MSRYLTDEELSIIRAGVPKYGGGHMKALIAEVERLRAEVGMLQQEARIRKNICDGLASEAAAERAAVLRWLRRVDANVYPSWVALADDIERGEHRRKEER